MILYIAHTKTRRTEERERERALRGREELGVFFIFFSVVLLLKFGRRKRARNFEFSFVRSLFPLHIVVIIISRRENDAIINNNNSREREKEKEICGFGRAFFVDFFCRASLTSSIEEEEEEEETSKKNATEEGHHHGRRRRRKRTNRRRRELEAKVTGGIFPRQQRHRRV